MIRNYYLNELANDIFFLEQIKDAMWTHRIFFPFIQDARYEILNFPFGDIDEDQLEPGCQNGNIYQICKKAGVPSPIVVDHFALLSSRNTIVRKRGAEQRKLEEPAICDLVRYDFSAPAPYRKFCIGIGEYDTLAGHKLYMCVLIDLYDRNIASVRFSEEKTTMMIREAIEHVISFSPCKEILVHSSQNKIYQSEMYKQVCKKYKVTMSMTDPGTRGGIMPVSTFFSTLKQRQGILFKDPQDAVDWLTAYVLKYNLDIVQKNKLERGL